METTDAGIRQGRRIRLLWLIDSLQMGGAEKLTALFAQSARGRFDLQVASLSSEEAPEIRDLLEKSGVSCTCLGARNLRDFRAFFRLIRMVRREKIEVIHAHLTYAEIWARLASLVTRAKVVSTLHVHRHRGSGALSLRDLVLEETVNFTRKYLGHTMIAVSDYLREEYVKRGIASRKILTLPNGVPASLKRSSPDFHRVRQELGIPFDVPVVISVSVLRPNKGHGVLLSAAKEVIEEMPETCFLMVGDGPQRSTLEAYAEQLNLGSNVRFLGQRSDVEALLSASDLFCLPSVSDSLPTAFMEAMMAKLPVIGLRSGGVSELIIDGKTGFLLSSTDPSRWAAKILRLTRDKATARKMGSHARRLAQERFSAKSWIAGLEDLYNHPDGPGPEETEAEEPSASRRPKVQFVEFVGKGGLIHYDFQLCRGLSRMGLEVKLLTSQDYELDSIPHEFEVEKLFRLWDPKPSALPRKPVSRLTRILTRVGRGLQYYSQWFWALLYLRQERPALVVFGDLRFPGDLIPLVLLRCMRIKMVDICHNVVPFDLRPGRPGLIRTSLLYHLCFRAIYQLFSDVFVHTASARQAFLGQYQVDPSRVRIIPHGNEELFGQLSGDISGNQWLRKLPEDVPTILFFGDLTKRKGLGDLVEAFHHVVREMPEAHLLIAGFPSPDVADLIDRLKSLRPKNILLDLRYIPNAEVSHYFRAADVVVFPYQAIYQSGVLQVAYTFGKPVVATRVGGFPEVVVDGETGLLVPPGDPRALAGALVALLSDPVSARRLGIRAQQLAETEYSWNTVAESFLEGIHHALV